MKPSAAKPILPTQPHSSIQRPPQARKQAPSAAITTTGTTAELLIYDDIGDFFGFGVSAAEVVEQISNIDSKVDTLVVRLNSPGGDVFDGAAIYNALARLKINVDIQVDGLAASIASIIAMAGDTITMADNALMMIHKPWMVSMGDGETLRGDAHLLDQVEVGLNRIYTARTGQPDATISDMMTAETWMTASEAIALGFADSSTEPVGAAAHMDLSRYPFQHVPKAWAEPAEPPPKAADYRERIAALATRIKQD